MEKKDIPIVHQLLTRYLKQFHLTPVMSQEEVEHWFYPQENIIDTFVVEVSGEGCSGPLTIHRAASSQVLGFLASATGEPMDGHVGTLDLPTLRARPSPKGGAVVCIC